MTGSLNVYDEIASFMASMDAKKVMAFKPSKENQERLDFLLNKKQESNLNEGETKELEHYLIVNRIVSLAKARALKLLAA